MSKRNAIKENGGIMEYPPESVPVIAGNGVPPNVLHPPLPPSDEDDPYMSFSEVARYVGKDRSTISRWVADGLLEAVRVGLLPKIRRSTLAKFLGGTALPQKV